MQLTTATGDMGLNPYEQMHRLENLPRDQQMAKVAGQFEGIMVRQFLTEAMKPMTDGCFSDEDMPGGDIYKSMMVDTLANGIESGGGMGFSNVIQLQLQGKASAGGTKGIANNADDNA
jgi:Rod binding domain-containing protein